MLDSVPKIMFLIFAKEGRDKKPHTLLKTLILVKAENLHLFWCSFELRGRLSDKDVVRFAELFYTNV